MELENPVKIKGEIYLENNEKARNVLAIIQKIPGISGKQIREVTNNLPRRTLYTILNRLIEAERVVKLPALRDARMYRFYPINVKT